jgi:pheromone shutdown-related protein TraB
MMTENHDIHRLAYEDKEIILIGTAHVSKESADLVARVIEQEKPETVCIELCQARYQSITQKQRWQNTDLVKVIKEKKTSLLLLNLMLASYQRRIGRKLGVKPGEEFLRAIQAAEAVGATIYLADRDIRITLSRTWRLMALWAKIKLLYQFLASVWQADSIKQEDIEEMKRRDVLEALLSELGKSLPELRRVLIDERDQYLAFRIRNAPGKRIVAVVGAGHVPGIQTAWERPIDMASLETMPPKGRFFALFKWIFPVLIVGLIVVGFLTSGSVAAAHMIRWWVVVKASLAGLGAALAFAHPLTILSAVVAAPITPFNPVIKVGFVAGLVEAVLGKPKVKDFENLLDDISSLKGFWRNKITRILLVVALTNMGSAVGTFVALSLMVKVLAS